MNNEATKMHLEKIDAYFGEIKAKIANSSSSLNKIENELKVIFSQDFSIKLLNTKPKDPCYVMSVYPDQSTIDKIVNSIINSESTSMVKEIWSKNTHWNIEIDKKIFDNKYVDLTSNEITALLLHEIGHTVISNSVPTRISNILKLEYAKVSGPVKKVFSKTKLSALLALPIFDVCGFESKSSDAKTVKNELDADKFAYQMGYKDALNSALKKFVDTGSNTVANTKKTLGFSVEVINQLKKREAKSAKNKLEKLRDSLGDSMVVSHINSIIRNSIGENEFVTESTHMNIICEMVDDIMDSYYTEFFVFGPKKLPKLETYTLDYIQVEMTKMKSQDDKLLLVSYLHSKLDICQYYLDILDNPKYAKKYAVPHTREYLVNYRTKLLQLRTEILKYPIEEKRYGLTIQYPSGYEG